MDQHVARRCHDNNSVVTHVDAESAKLGDRFAGPHRVRGTFAWHGAEHRADVGTGDHRVAAHAEPLIARCLLQEVSEAIASRRYFDNNRGHGPVSGLFIGAFDERIGGEHHEIRCNGVAAIGRVPVHVAINDNVRTEQARGNDADRVDARGFRASSHHPDRSNDRRRQPIVQR